MQNNLKISSTVVGHQIPMPLFLYSLLKAPVCLSRRPCLIQGTTHPLFFQRDVYMPDTCLNKIFFMVISIPHQVNQQVLLQWKNIFSFNEGLRHNWYGLKFQSSWEEKVYNSRQCSSNFSKQSFLLPPLTWVWQTCVYSYTHSQWKEIESEVWPWLFADFYCQVWTCPDST